MDLMRGLAMRGWVVVVCLACSGHGAWADYKNRLLLDEPLGYWRLNDKLSPTAANLGSLGAGLDGQFVGGQPGAQGPTELADDTPVLGMGSNNVALDLGGTAYVSFDESPLSGLEEFTVSGWFRIRELSQDRVGLIGQNDAIELGFVQPNQLQLWTAQGGSVTWQFDPNSQLPSNEWFYLAAVGTGQQLQLYVNAQNVQSGGTAVSTNYGVSTFPLRIGGGGIFDATGNQFLGTVDEVAIWDKALSSEQIEQHFAAALGGGIPGDFDSNGRIEAADVNLLQRAIYEGSDDLLFDVDNDLEITDDDLVFWIGDIAFSWRGDANLDGEFNSSDFVTVLAAGEYEDAIAENSRWETGDWNADLEFNSRDLVDSLAEGGYEVGPAATRPIPEPTGWLLGLMAIAYPLVATRACRLMARR
jgi:hypothetical protein